VGVDDNFFAIGGDSILSLQIVGRAKQQGIHLVTKDLFQHQTIRELATVARVGTQTQAEQGVVTGELPLTPIQQWFLAQDWREPHHFNQALLLTVAPTVNPTWLASALTALLHHHDALRLRFQPRAERAASGQAPSQQWRQVNQGIAEAVALELVDLSMLAGPARQAQLAAVANRTQASLHLSDGPLLRAVLFTGGEQESKRLLLVIHHLAVDGVSWRILLEDLQSAYQQCRQGQPIKLPAKTTAFRDWARWLADQGVKQVEAEGAWWAQVVHDAAAHTRVDLPTDFPEQGGAEQGEFAPSKNSFASADQVACTLSAAETDALLHQAPAAYHTQVNDLLLTALARTMSDWLGTPSISLELEGHGREFSEVAENAAMTIDLSRTVGWFTTMFPVILHCDQPETGALIKSIKEQLRQIPNRGIGYGILRYLGQRAELTPPNPIALSFNYLGQFATGKPGADEQKSADETAWLLNFAPESSGEAQSAQGQRPHLLAITGQVIEGQLQVSWQYSRHFHQPTTIAALAETYMTHLRAIIAHCLNPAAGGFTPSDFSALTIEQTELDQLVADIGLALAE
jgi:non-ribosomal peptide synthase protein (TIGR01720 family)